MAVADGFGLLKGMAGSPRNAPGGYVDPVTQTAQLVEVLGREFAGMIGSDYFSIHRKYMGDCHALVPFCLAHLIRDAKFLTTLPERSTVAYGQQLLEALSR